MQDETKEVSGNHFFFTTFSGSDEHWVGDAYRVQQLVSVYWHPMTEAA